MRGTEHPIDELIGDRFIEPQPGAFLLEYTLLNATTVTSQLQLDNVARHHPEQYKRDECHAQQRRDHQQDAVDDVAIHAVTLPGRHLNFYPSAPALGCQPSKSPRVLHPPYAGLGREGLSAHGAPRGPT